MAAYSQLILTKDTATFKGEGLDDKVIDVGDVQIPPFSTMYVDFVIGGDKRNLGFGPKRGTGTYQVVVTTNPESTEEYIPITAKLIGDTKKALVGKTSLAADETIEIGTIKGGADERTLSIRQIETMTKEAVAAGKPKPVFAQMQTRWTTPPDTRSKLTRLFTSAPQPTSSEERVVLGTFVNAKEVGTAYNGGIIVTFQRPDGSTFDVSIDQRVDGDSGLFLAGGGGRRSRLNVQRRRTQRNRRNRKGRQLRKLTTRRR